ncbi:Beta-mannanase [Limihaloglobus sulfuriphilus]|uniref:Beta-mannanase n=1 Tax=Limihaloglobus sulfuriphilus TaxID=1851148 RepID=A0A1Q2MCU1_9BACT|nr:glycosyl hydrolase [Limihaloglobus sulfuriphilus]AQQ70511.1 Beta-mannanase [Limihaloglobus sulfuriphilus]
MSIKINTVLMTVGILAVAAQGYIIENFETYADTAELSANPQIYLPGHGTSGSGVAYNLPTAELVTNDSFEGSKSIKFSRTGYPAYANFGFNFKSLDSGSLDLAAYNKLRVWFKGDASNPVGDLILTVKNRFTSEISKTIIADGTTITEWTLIEVDIDERWSDVGFIVFTARKSDHGTVNMLIDGLEALVSETKVEPTAFQKQFMTYGNLSVGKFYKFSHDPLSGFSDEWPNKWTDGSKLTNETFNETTFSQKEWLGWQADSTPVEIVLDLGKSYNIDTVKLHCCSYTNTGIYYPSTVNIHTKTQHDQQWQHFVQITGGGDTETFSDKWLRLESSFTPARYIQISAAGPGGTLMIDEIEIYGEIVNEWKHVPDYGMYHGAFAVEEHGWWNLSYYEEQANKKTSMVLWYHQLNPNENNSSFSEGLSFLWRNPKYLSKNTVGERYLTIGWLPRWSTAQDIAQGIDGYDEHFEQWFSESIDYSMRYGNSDPIWLRPMNEMNGGWTFPTEDPENSSCWGGDPLNYRRAWRRLYNIAEQVGAADKHVFLWSPNGYTWAGEDHRPDKYYPGDQYVDWVGISMYSQGDEPYPNNTLTGTAGPGSFDFYGTWPHKPMMISEGAWKPGKEGDAERWINEWFDMPHNFPRIKAAVWFNGTDIKISEALSPNLVDLFRQRLSEPSFLSSPSAGRLDFNFDGNISLEDLAICSSNWKRLWKEDFRNNLINTASGALISDLYWSNTAQCDASEAWVIDNEIFERPSVKISQLPAGQTADMFTRLPSSEHYQVSGKIVNLDEFAAPYSSSFMRICFESFLVNEDNSVSQPGWTIEIYRNAFGETMWADGFRIRDREGTSLASNYLGKLERPYAVPFIFQRSDDNVYISIGDGAQKIEQHIVSELDPSNSALRFYHQSMGPQASDSWVITDLKVFSNFEIDDIDGNRHFDESDLMFFSEKWLQNE